MTLRGKFSSVLVLAFLGAALVAIPAQATPQTGLGFTLDVTINPGTQSGLEATAWLPPSGGTAVASLSGFAVTDTLVSIES